VRIGLIAQDNCHFAKRLVRAIAPRLESLQLPVRDAVSTYPTVLTERDPCQVLSVFGDDVEAWDVGRSRPFECDFSLKRGGEVVTIRVTLKTSAVRHGHRNPRAPPPRRRRNPRRRDVLLGGGERCVAVVDFASAAAKLYG
jgi:hypothetical protein